MGPGGRCWIQKGLPAEVTLVPAEGLPEVVVSVTHGETGQPAWWEQAERMTTGAYTNLAFSGTLSRSGMEAL